MRIIPGKVWMVSVACLFVLLYPLNSATRVYFPSNISNILPVYCPTAQTAQHIEALHNPGPPLIRTTTKGDFVVEQRVINFSAGPAALPLKAMEKAHEEFLCLPGAGASVMEISHRCKAFDAVHQK